MHDAPAALSEHVQPHIRRAAVVVPCVDLGQTLAFLCERLGFHVATIFPAEAPAVAVLDGHGLRVRLIQLAAGEPAPPVMLHLAIHADGVRALLAHLGGRSHAILNGPHGLRIEIEDADRPVEVPLLVEAFVVTRHGDDSWATGRAGMQYRDLIPGRLGGRFIASHIRIRDGGPVPDYVHYHRVRFQMIFVKSGWVRVVYEDQGAPFVMNAGDCVLQPPEIRHRVLEASPGLEVIEIGCPALHETHGDIDIALPNATVNRTRDFAGQRFVLHVASEAAQSDWMGDHRVAVRDTGIGAATAGLASAKVWRARDSCSGIDRTHTGEFSFLFVLHGALQLVGGALADTRLGEGDSVTIPASTPLSLTAEAGTEWLEVRLPADE
jgi:mannose-6-phosphate isomerase-like protein (cupin superfamily)